MKSMNRVFNKILICFAAVLMLCSFPPVHAESTVDNAFKAFMDNGAGRFYTADEDGFIVLELIPAFGKLFASSAYYTKEASLYSYFASELLPLTGSPTSFVFNIRSFSNMSRGGNYWEGETRQRLSLQPYSVLISDYHGDGDPLISKKPVLLIKQDDLPTIFPYNPSSVQKMYGNTGTTALPEYLKGVWLASLMSNGSKVTVNLSLESDGTMTLLREPPNNYPPILAKGGYVLSQDSEDIFTLCYLVSSPSHGTMPYDGCVKLWSDGIGMILEDKGEEFRYLLMMGKEHIGFEKIR
ncbi:MAG: hypothetical protein IJI57_10765 [Flexilinea sp.]|nr:hypothetical protein [Flexilinea sp.]